MADPPMPDLSHLSAEERAIIEQVFQRQKEEEEKEVQISQYVFIIYYYYLLYYKFFLEKPIKS